MSAVRVTISFTPPGATEPIVLEGTVVDAEAAAAAADTTAVVPPTAAKAVEEEPTPTPVCYDLSTYKVAWCVDVPLGCRDVAVSADGSAIAVVIPETHTMRTFRAATGEHVATWGSKGYGKGQFNEPVAVCANPEGGWCVAEWGNLRVQLLDADGAHCGFIMSNAFTGVELMWGITCDRRNNNVSVGVCFPADETGYSAPGYIPHVGVDMTFGREWSGVRVALDVNQLTGVPYVYTGDGRTSSGSAPRYMRGYKAMTVDHATGDVYALRGGTLCKLVR